MISFTWIRHQHSRLDLEVICRWPKKYSVRNETMIFKDSDILEIWHRHKFEGGGVGVFKMMFKAHLLFKTRTDLAIFLSFFLSFPKLKDQPFVSSLKMGRLRCWFSSPSVVGLALRLIFWSNLFFYEVKKSLQSTNWTTKVPPLHHQSSWITECPWLGLRLCSKLFLIWDSWRGRQRDENPGLK